MDHCLKMKTSAEPQSYTLFGQKTAVIWGAGKFVIVLLIV